MSGEPNQSGLLGRWLQIRPGEWGAASLSFLYFALLLASYYTLRPVRDALVTGVIGASEIRFAASASPACRAVV